MNPTRFFELIINIQFAVSFLLLKIHGMSLDVVPLFVHKLPQQCRDVLVTDRFLYVTDEHGKSLSVVSCLLSESDISGESVSIFILCFLIYTLILCNSLKDVCGVYFKDKFCIENGGRLGRKRSGEYAVCRKIVYNPLPRIV